MVYEQAAIKALPQNGKVMMSYEAFLAWVDEDRHAEWVNGEVIEFMPAKRVHQNCLQFLYELLALFIRLRNLGEILVAPTEMRLTRSSREPDILFVSTKNRHRLTADRVEGAADLVVEIISSDSVSRDRRDKFQEYRLEGVQEYWIIDPRPNKQRADFFTLTPDGQYDLFGTEEDEKVESRLLSGFWLQPAWLWQADKLDPFVLFCEIRGLTPEQIAGIQRLLAGNV